MHPLVALLLALPAALETQIAADYPGWRLAPSAPQIREWFAAQRFGYSPAAAEADFDADGRRDHVILLIAGGRQIAVVYLARDNGWRKHELAADPPDPFTYLLVQRRGERDFDFERLRHFRHAQDSVLVMYFERTPLHFVWRQGRFERRLAINDEEIERN